MLAHLKRDQLNFLYWWMPQLIQVPKLTGNLCFWFHFVLLGNIPFFHYSSASSSADITLLSRTTIFWANVFWAYINKIEQPCFEHTLIRWIFQLTLLSIGTFHITRHTIRVSLFPFVWFLGKASFPFGIVCPELCPLNCGRLFRALFLTRDILEIFEVVPVIVCLLLNQTVCGYNNKMTRCTMR